MDLKFTQYCSYDTEVIYLLDSNNIEYDIYKLISKPSHIGEFGNEVCSCSCCGKLEYVSIQIKKDDFESVDNLLLNTIQNSHNISRCKEKLIHYSKNKLLKTIIKEENNNRLEYLLAQQILAERGIVVNQKQLDFKRKMDIHFENTMSILFIGIVLLVLSPLILLFILFITCSILFKSKHEVIDEKKQLFFDIENPIIKN